MAQAKTFIHQPEKKTSHINQPQNRMQDAWNFNKEMKGFPNEYKIHPSDHTMGIH